MYGSERKSSFQSTESYTSEYLINYNNSSNIHNSDVEKEIKSGVLKFFDEAKSFGFIVNDED